MRATAAPRIWKWGGGAMYKTLKFEEGEGCMTPPLLLWWHCPSSNEGLADVSVPKRALDRHSVPDEGQDRKEKHRMTVFRQSWTCGRKQTVSFKGVTEPGNTWRDSEWVFQRYEVERGLIPDQGNYKKWRKKSELGGEEGCRLSTGGGIPEGGWRLF